ncbi:hypothetical protein [Aquabacterium sp. A08]|uniref:hypothetical protein n=1 Tax=Aquabacterium sp. A08 TaxID=2718532 RepID=UPI0014243644|nr:hypothetical protein [Aquabacterium sp. A08]NIC43623.1 hypothetical protein [Aquabacterium sp. A08]
MRRSAAPSHTPNGLLAATWRRRFAATALVVCATNPAAWAAEDTSANAGLSPKQVAQTMAIGDSLSTGLGLAAGAVEANPLVSTTPLGLVALAGMKLLMLNEIDKYPEEQRVPLQRKMSSFWGGLTANNLMLAAGATGGLAIPAGLLASYMIYNSEKFEQAEAAALAKANQKHDFRVSPTYTVVTELSVRPAKADGSYDPDATLTTVEVKTTNPLLAKVNTYLHPDGTKYYVEGHRLKTTG